MPSFSIIILTYNSSRHIENFIHSLFSKFGNSLKEHDIEIIFFDNNSNDDTLGKIKQYVKDYSPLLLKDFEKSNSGSIKIISSGENLGYAMGINHANAYATGTNIIILNPDSEVISLNFADMKEMFERQPKLFAIGGKLIKADNVSVEKTAGRFYTFLDYIFFSIGLEKLLNIRFAPRKSQTVDFVSGGAIALNRSHFENIGGFDERYFMYVEDMDICFRAKEKKLSVRFGDYIVIKHFGQGSSNREFAIVNIYKGLVLFAKIHYGSVGYFYVRLLLMFKAYLIISLGLLTNSVSLANTYKKALKEIA